MLCNDPSGTLVERVWLSTADRMQSALIGPHSNFLGPIAINCVTDLDHTFGATLLAAEKSTNLGLKSTNPGPNLTKFGPKSATY